MGKHKNVSMSSGDSFAMRTGQGAPSAMSAGNGGAYSENTRVHKVHGSRESLFPDGTNGDSTITLAEYRKMS